MLRLDSMIMCDQVQFFLFMSYGELRWGSMLQGCAAQHPQAARGAPTPCPQKLGPPQTVVQHAGKQHQTIRQNDEGCLIPRIQYEITQYRPFKLVDTHLYYMVLRNIDYLEVLRSCAGIGLPGHKHHQRKGTPYSRKSDKHGSCVPVFHVRCQPWQLCDAISQLKTYFYLFCDRLHSKASHALRTGASSAFQSETPTDLITPQIAVQNTCRKFITHHCSL